MKSIKRSNVDTFDPTDENKPVVPTNQTTRPIKLAFITCFPVPYREGLFDELARRSEIDLEVFYCTQGRDGAGWSGSSTYSHHRFARTTLTNWTPKRFEGLPLIGYCNFSIGKQLKQFSPDYAIIHGTNQLTHLIAAKHCRQNNIPYALRGDTNAYLKTKESIASGFRQSMVQRLVKNCHAVLPLGKANELYWRNMGASTEQIFHVGEPVDNDRIRSLIDSDYDSQDELFRLDRPLRMLFVGRMLPRKGVDLLMDAMNRLCEQNIDLELAMIGDGEFLNEYRSMQSSEAQKRTNWVGRIPNDEVFGWMAKSDLFVLPSRYEPWGCVVNEAMACGLPILAHRHVGAAIDLVEHDVNGWLFNQLNADAIAAQIQFIYERREELASMGQAASKTVDRWSFQNAADGVIDLLQNAVEQNNVEMQSQLNNG